MILDAGVLVSVDRREARARAFLAAAVAEGTDLATSAAVVAQVWRGGPRQTLLARFLNNVDVHPLRDGHRIGELLGRAGRTDPVDAHVVLLASILGRPALTSAVDDLQRLAHVLRSGARPTVLAW